MHFQDRAHSLLREDKGVDGLPVQAHLESTYVVEHATYILSLTFLSLYFLSSHGGLLKVQKIDFLVNLRKNRRNIRKSERERKHISKALYP